MGKIRQAIHVDGRTCWTLFDAGARNTYVIPAVAKMLKTSPMPTTISVRESNTAALLEATVEGHPISTHALVIEEGADIEILFGALAMQQWGIRPIPDEKRLDLSHYPETFVEF